MEFVPERATTCFQTNTKYKFWEGCAALYNGLKGSSDLHDKTYKGKQFLNR